MATFDDHLDSLFDSVRPTASMVPVGTTASQPYDDGDPLISSVGGDITSVMQADVNPPFASMMLNATAHMGVNMMPAFGMGMEEGAATAYDIGVRNEGGHMGHGSSKYVGEQQYVRAKQEEDLDSIGSPVTGDSAPDRMEDSTERSSEVAIEEYEQDGETGGSAKGERQGLEDEDSTSVVSGSQGKNEKISGSIKKESVVARGRGPKRNGAVVRRGTVSPVRRNTHNSHTKRCRLKVNLRFQELVDALPKPPSDVEVKHKAQILEYAIKMYKKERYERARLQAELRLSTNANLNKWITQTVKGAKSLQDALTPYFDLLCTRAGWKFAEAWYPVRKGKAKSITAPLAFGFGHIPEVSSPADEQVRPRMQMFLEESKVYRFEPRKGVPGRVSVSMRPEWLENLSDGGAFVRAPIATKRAVLTCFGVPIITSGYVAAVGIFFDTQQRGFDIDFMNQAHHIANCIGNAYGAYKG